MTDRLKRRQDERYRSVAELRESEERQRLALEAADQGLYDLNVQTGEAVVSPEYARMLGYEPEEFVETNAEWRERLHPDDREPVYRVYEDYIAGRRPDYRVEFRQRTKSGDWKWILSLGKIVAWDAEGRPLRMLGTHTDISERKQADARLYLQSTALNAVANAIVITDPQGDIVWANQAFEALTGYRLDEAIGLNPRQLIKSGVHDRAFYQQMWETILSGQIWRGEVINRHKDGHLYTEEMTITPVFEKDGQIGHFVAVKQDITARRQMEKALKGHDAILGAISYASAALLRISNVHQVFPEVLERLGRATDASRVYLFEHVGSKQDGLVFSQAYE